MEEDIKELEEIIKKYRNDNVNMLDLDSNDLFKRLILKEEQVQLLENLIKGYRELEEENEELKRLANNKQWISPCYVAQNYIPKSKIKEKIEEWDKSIKWNNADDRYYAIKILKELMEDK